MSVTTYQGTVENGGSDRGDVCLPENAKVYVFVPDVEKKACGMKFDSAEVVSLMLADHQENADDFGEAVGKVRMVDAGLRSRQR
jgi:hypothetical protein